MSSIKMNEGFSEANAFCDSMPAVPKKVTPVGELVKNCGFTYRQIEKRSGGVIAYNTLTGLVNDLKPNPELKTMLALAKGTGVPFLHVAAAFAGAYLPDLGLKSDYLKELLLAYESLTEKEREPFAGTVKILAEKVHEAVTAKLPDQ